MNLLTETFYFLDVYAIPSQHHSQKKIMCTAWISIHKTGNCNCIARCGYIFKVVFQVVSWIFSRSFYNYFRRGEPGIFVNLLVFLVFFS